MFVTRKKYQELEKKYQELEKKYQELSREHFDVIKGYIEYQTQDKLGLNGGDLDDLLSLCHPLKHEASPASVRMSHRILLAKRAGVV